MKSVLLVFTVFNLIFLTGCSLFDQKEVFDFNQLPPTSAGSVITVTSQVSASADDVEQTSSGNIYIASSDLELIMDGSSEQIVALRFRVDVPQGANITNATIQFTSDEVTTGPAALQIFAEASDNATAFESGDTIGLRPTTQASVSWSPLPWDTVGEAGDAQLTPSLTAITQEVIERSGWTRGNHLAYLISGTGTRTAESYDGSASAAPILTISYSLIEQEPEPEQPTQPTDDMLSVITQVSMASDDAEEHSNGGVTLGSSDLELANDGNSQQIIAMRFKLDVPQGAIIENSQIQFTTDERSYGAASLTIYAEDTDNATSFASTLNNIKNRTITTDFIDWSPNEWDVVGSATSDQQTPSLNTLTQHVINRSDWVQGNYISYIFTGSGTRTAESFDGAPNDAPQLTVFYSLPGSPDEIFVYNGHNYTANEKLIYDRAYRDGFMSIDTDLDGLPDSWELSYGLDPSNPNDAIDQTLDPDNDVLTALEEFLSGTNPNDIDTDGDGLPDGYELAYNLSPINSADALLDIDGDGYSNLIEFLQGSAPDDNNDKPDIDAPEPTSYSVALSWGQPTIREDNSPLNETDISGFVINYGPSSALPDDEIYLSDPAQTNYTISNLMAGTYFFTISTIGTDGRKSKPSEQIELTFPP